MLRGDASTPSRWLPRVVHKWPVPVDDEWHRFEVPPGGARVVHVACQGAPSIVMVWVEVVDPELVPGGHNDDWLREDAKPVEFRVFGTGHLVPSFAVHVGSAVVAGGALVWHVYGRE